jgi:hypothetical protein
MDKIQQYQSSANTTNSNISSFDLKHAVHDIENDWKRYLDIQNRLTWSKKAETVKQNDLKACEDLVNQKKPAILKAMSTATYDDYLQALSIMRQIDAAAVTPIAIQREKVALQRLLSAVQKATADVDRLKSFDFKINKIFKDSHQKQRGVETLIAQCNGAGNASPAFLLQEVEGRRLQLRIWFEQQLLLLRNYLTEIRTLFGEDLARLGVPEARRKELEEDFKPLFAGYEYLVR